MKLHAPFKPRQRAADAFAHATVRSGLLAGHVKFWSATRNYGVLAVDPGQPTEIEGVHCSATIAELATGSPALSVGARVQFRAVCFGDKAPTAMDLAVLEDAPAAAGPVQNKYAEYRSGRWRSA